MNILSKLVAPNQLALATLFLLFILLGCSPSEPQYDKILGWPDGVTSAWAGPYWWANRTQDWQVKDGALQCIEPNMPLRTVHLLTATLPDSRRQFVVETTLKPDVSNPTSFAGLLIGAGAGLDYRAAALVHGAVGTNAGYAAVWSAGNKLLLLNLNQASGASKSLMAPAGKLLLSVKADKKPDTTQPIRIKATYMPDRGILEITALQQNNTLATLQQSIDYERIKGNVALLSSGGKPHFISLSHRGLDNHPRRKFGPVAGAPYTVQPGRLRVNATLMPVGQQTAQALKPILEIKPDTATQWQQIATAKVITPGYTAFFDVENWPDTLSIPYRIAVTLPFNQETFYYYGTIAANPVHKNTVTVAAFTGNNNSSQGITHTQAFSFTKDALWFPHADLTQNVTYHKPDLLFYSGDQLYEGRPTPADMRGGTKSELDYLYKWYVFLWAHDTLLNHMPSVILPDDHDVFHGNIWGMAGKKAPNTPENGVYPDYYKGFEAHWQQDQGGYKMPAWFVKMVDRTQTGHLPNPANPDTIAQGITTYYTNLDYGRISFGIFEDRKFKSAPSQVMPQAKAVNGFAQVSGFDAADANIPHAKLMGDKQLDYMRGWAADYTGVDMKVSLMQSIFATISTFPDTFKTDAGTPHLDPLPQGEIPKNYKMAIDMDANGWPKVGRDKALDALRRGFTFMIGGDQHLASVVHHGINQWEDAGWSFCVPSIANIWPRRWFPPATGLNHKEGMPPYTGRFFDGFNNRVTVYAVSNPYISNKKPASLHDRAPGYGIVHLNRTSRTITMECWPRHANPEHDNQYPGWPITIKQTDNYNRPAWGYLPTIEVMGLENPVVQVINEADLEIIYTLRLNGKFFTPKVFKPGHYMVWVGEQDTDTYEALKNLEPKQKPGIDTVRINLQKVRVDL